MSKIEPGDINYALKKAVLGSIPLVGTGASELFAAIVKSPLEKRITQLLSDLEERLKQLENKKDIDLNDLSTNDQFIDIVLKATNLAVKTSEKEKLVAFQNMILNTAAGLAPEKAKSEIFLNLLDSFTIWHIRILNFINDPKAWHDKSDQKLSPLSSMSIWSVLEMVYPELRGQLEFTELIWSDLERARLHNTTQLRSNMTVGALLVPRTTGLGKEFLRFISAQNW